MPGRVGAGVVWSWGGRLRLPLLELASLWWVKRLPLLEHPLLTPTSPEKSPAQAFDLGVESSTRHSIVQASKKSHPYSKRPHR